MSAETPRLAAFDDLRVGQWVAWVETPGLATARLAEVQSITHGNVVRAQSEDGVPLDIARGWPIVILIDAPAPPVTVRREDYDALADVARRWAEDSHAPPGTRANLLNLVDNANTGADR